MFKFLAKIFVFVGLSFAFNQAIAAHASSLYDVDILVADESANTRREAFKQGLDEVFVRISGDSIIMDKLKRPSATTYVKQYSYEPVDKQETNRQGLPLTHHLKIQYNGSAMEKYLLKNGFPVWGAHRPEVVIWLAVRDGRNEYVLKNSDQSLLKSVADDALLRRGVPQRWPLYDAKDRKLLSVTDIRGGFKEPVINASKRYSRGPALTASLSWNGKEWQGNWSLLMKTGNRHWSLVNRDYNLLINKAIDQAADALGVVFAIRGSVDRQQLLSVQLAIQAVNSIEKYRRVESYLTGLNAVESINPVQVDGQNALFELVLRSDKDDFLNLIKNDAELIEVNPPPVNKPADDILIPVKEPVAGVEQPVTSADVKTDNASLAKQKDPLPVYYYKLIN